jgi:hypothetical protein
MLLQAARCKLHAARLFGTIINSIDLLTAFGLSALGCICIRLQLIAYSL